MDRRTFHKLTGLAAAGAFASAAAQQSPKDWKSGQGSPVHDSDRLMPEGGATISLENEHVRVDVNQRTGALTGLFHKLTGWQVQKQPRLAASFRIFAPQPDRAYNPILGERNFAQSVSKSDDGRSLTIVWTALRSEYTGTLDITLNATITLEGSNVLFDMTVKNASPYPIASVEWPIIGAIALPAGASTMNRIGFAGTGNAREAPMYPRFPQELPWCGTSFPSQVSTGRYTLILAEREGVYIANHSRTRDEAVKFFTELKPGYLDSKDLSVPPVDEINGHPVRMTTSVQHFPFTAPGATSTLSPTCIAPFSGDWHKGADIFRRWFFSWYKRPIQPKWMSQPHSWQQIQINSSEEDLRTTYRELPRRALQAAKAGIQALQLTGWNKDGQDHGNPTQDTEPRLGTHQDLKDAIARIEKMGVRVILFNKYNYADTSTDWYKSELHKHMVLDVHGIPYVMQGYRYQTPEQLADMDTRRFAAACTNDAAWLDVCAKEFDKTLAFGASGILNDEACGHATAECCFATTHGHPSPVSVWSGDHRVGSMLREKVRATVGEENFAMAGENLYDLQTELYSLSYIRIFGEDHHLPVARYNDPQANIMIAIDGFDDRNMINAALRYRYVMSFESFNFKGDMDDFPTTVAYGQKMNAFREKYRAYVWDGEFRDDQDAMVTADARAYRGFSVFLHASGRRCAVIVNEGKRPIDADVKFAGESRGTLVYATPEMPDQRACNGSVTVSPRSAVLVMES